MLGSRLAAERRRLGLSQKQLGNLWQVGRSAIAMIEGGHAPLDAQRLVIAGVEGFDVLFILTGERAQFAAGKLIDWNLCVALMEQISAWEERRKKRIPVAKKALVVKHLYLKFAQSDGVVGEDVEEMLRMVA